MFVVVCAQWFRTYPDNLNRKPKEEKRTGYILELAESTNLQPPHNRPRPAPGRAAMPYKLLK
jgi:hypothetical protein